MTERHPFPSNKTAADFDEAKRIHFYKPLNDVSPSLKATWSPAGRLVAWTSGDTSITITPWDRTRQSIVESIQDDDLQFTQRVLQTGKLVKALALGSSIRGSKADYGTKISRNKPVNNGGCPEPSGSCKSSWFRYHKVEGLVLAVGFQNGQIRCFNAYTGDLILELLDHQQVITDLKFASDGSLRLASCSAEGKVKLWDLTDDGNMYKTVQSRGYRGPIYSCAWSPDAHTLVIVGQMGLVSVWDMADNSNIKERHLLTGHHHSVTSCQFTPDGGLLLTSSLDSRVILWNPYLGTKLCEYGHLFPTPSLIFASGANSAGVIGASLCSDGQHMATICEDKYIRIWQLHSEKGPVQVVPSTEPGPSICLFAPIGNTFITGPYNQGISFIASPYGTPAALRQLTRSAIHQQLQKKTPGMHIPKVIEDMVSEGFLPRDLKDFVQYKTLCAH